MDVPVTVVIKVPDGTDPKLVQNTVRTAVRLHLMLSPTVPEGWKDTDDYPGKARR